MKVSVSIFNCPITCYSNMKVKKHMDSFESVAKFGTVLQFLVLAALLAVAAADSAYPAYHQASYSAPSYSAKSYDYVS